MFNKLRSKKGFTLVELCLVLAIMAIVVTMVVTFIAQYNKDTYSLFRNRTAMVDINFIRNITNEWIEYYDNGNYEISPSDAVNGSFVLQAKETNSRKVDSLEISGGVVVWKKNGAEHRKYTFESVNEGIFTFNAENSDGKKPVIKLRVYFNNGNNWQDLLFAVMTMTPRNRYSPAQA